MNTLTLQKRSNREDFFARFAFLLGECRGNLHQIFEDEDLMFEFNCRQITKSDLESLESAMDKVSQGFYNAAQPA